MSFPGFLFLSIFAFFHFSLGIKFIEKRFPLLL